MNMTAATAPESIRGPMTVARLRDWVREAQPGARLIYARGASAANDCGRAVVREVQRLGAGIVEDGVNGTGGKGTGGNGKWGNGKGGGDRPGLALVRAHFMRGAEREGLYVVVRLPRPVRAGELP